MNVKYIASILLLFSAVLVFGQESDYRLMVLGIAQDGGHPQAGCIKSCCADAKKQDYVASLAVVEQSSRKVWLIDCSPDFREQWTLLMDSFGTDITLEGIFLTHAHVGHYLGLAQLGREVMGSKDVAVYAMPRMSYFLHSNGPWDQLERLNNIQVNELTNEVPIELSDEFSVTPFLVPHRDEYTETVGFLLKGIQQRILYIPDIDKWSTWDKDLAREISGVDMAFIDATFYDAKELPGRDMSEIPHPFVVESMDVLKKLEEKERMKVHFIHMNHSNPMLSDPSIKQKVEGAGFRISIQGEIHLL